MNTGLCETIKRILNRLYPNNEEFFNFIFLPKGSKDFLPLMKKWIETHAKPSAYNEPFNALYGIIETEKPAKKIKSDCIFELNKTNVDLLFSVIKKCITDGSSNEKTEALENDIEDAFNSFYFKEISFFANIENYSTSSALPMNFFALALSLRVLHEIYYGNIKNYSFGVFSSGFSEEMFYTDLFSSYLLLLYFFYINESDNKILSLSFFDDNDINYDSFTYHVEEQEAAISKISIKALDFFALINDLYNISTIRTVELKFFYSIEDGDFDKIKSFLSMQKFLDTVTIYGSIDICNKFSSYVFPRALNIHVLPSDKENEYVFSNDKKSNNIKHFLIHGDNIVIKEIPENLNSIRQFGYISKNDKSDFPGLPQQTEALLKFEYMQKIELDNITIKQFRDLFSSGNSFKYLKDISVSINTDLKTKNKYLKPIDEMIKNPNNENVQNLVIKINNMNNNYFFLSKENGFYFINSVMKSMKKCKVFSFTNHNDNNEINPFLNSVGKGEYCMEALPGAVATEVRKDLYITFTTDSNLKLKSVNDVEKALKPAYTADIPFNTLLVIITKKLQKLKVKPILALLFKCLSKERGRVYLVGDFNN